MALPSVVNRMLISDKSKINPNFSYGFKALRERTDVLQEKGIVTTVSPNLGDKDGEKTIRHPDSAFLLYQQMYQKIPVAKCAIDHTANFAIQSGYELDGDESSVKTIEEWIDKVNFDIILLDAMKQLQIYGNAYLEITDIENPKFLPASQMFVIVHVGGEDGKIKGYKQKIQQKEPISFTMEEMVHFKWNVESGLPESGFYGVSDLKAATSTLKKLLNFQDSLSDVMQRHAEPLIHWTIGTEDSPGTQAQVSAFIDNLGDREKGGDLITSYGVEGKAIASDLRMVQPDGMIKHLENQLIAAMQVPEIFIRGGETSNKATADVELQAFDRRVKALRSIASMFIEDYIFPKLLKKEDNPDKKLGPEKKVKIMWNEPSFETESKKATMIKDMYAAGMPLEVAMKIAGWGAFLNDLEEAGGERQPIMPMGDEEDKDKPKDKPDKKPKEEDYPIQADYYDALENWSRLK